MPGRTVRHLLRPSPCFAAQAAAAAGLELRSVPPLSCVPPGDLASGWYGNVRILLLWPAGCAAPALAGGASAEALQLLGEAEGLGCAPVWQGAGGC